MTKGFVTLVGAGPAGPELLTLAGYAALKSADCVIHDRLVDQRIIDLARESAERIYVGKFPGTPKRCPEQEAINELLIKHAQMGKQIVRLKGGDAFLFGRGGEEIHALEAAGIPYAVIPGVTAASAAAAGSGIPLTHRGLSSAVAFVAGHEDPGKTDNVDFDSLARFPGTLVVYMPILRSQLFANALVASGKPASTQVTFVGSAYGSRQQIHATTLGEIASGGFAATELVQSPAVALIGDVCSLKQSTSWLELRPLHGLGILSMRPSERDDDLATTLTKLGAQVFSSPAMMIDPPESWEVIDEVIGRLESFDWIAFASPNGVRMFFERLHEKNHDARSFARTKFAVVGPGSRDELKRFGVIADAMPDNHNAESLAQLLGPKVPGLRLLLPRADCGSTTLEERLAHAGAKVDAVIAYRQRACHEPNEAVKKAILEGRVHWALLTSPNIARTYVGWLNGMGAGGQQTRIKVAAMSSAIALEAARLGLQADSIAENSSLDGLIEAIVQFERRERQITSVSP